MDLYLLIIVLSLSSFAGGYLAAYVHTWTLRRFLLDLDYRLTDLEGRLSREVKLRAAGESVKSRESDRKLEKWAEEHRSETAVPGTAVNVPPFAEWYRNKMKST